MKSFQDITADDAKQHCATLAYGDYSKYEIKVTLPFSVAAVFVPQDKKAYMDDGLGGKTPFYVDGSDGYGNPWYSNGEHMVLIDNVWYDVYGVFTPASGSLFIYIE